MVTSSKKISRVIWVRRGYVFVHVVLIPLADRVNGAEFIDFIDLCAGLSLEVVLLSGVVRVEVVLVGRQVAHPRHEHFVDPFDVRGHSFH